MNPQVAHHGSNRLQMRDVDIPRSADEADAMLDMTIIFTDATKITPEIVTNPSSAIRTYVGYTQEELLRGSVGVSVR
jgi:hypothetical protein